MNNLGEGVRRKVLYNARNRIHIMVNENVLDQVRDDVCDRTMDEIFVVVPFIGFDMRFVMKSLIRRRIFSGDYE